MSPLSKEQRIVILGAGPTGLGAGHRLQELGFSNFTIIEKEDHAGGLASSFVDSKGFTWDIGGHVQFSHYEYFDRLMNLLMGDEWVSHQRESWIWVQDRFIPYPMQLNIRHLPYEIMRECLKGLIKVSVDRNGSLPANFEEWIFANFGEGIAKHFMLPYNSKVWAHSPADMSTQWLGERVARVDLERIIFNIVEEKDDVQWGPNNRFRFPLRGGTGEIWRRLATRFHPDQLKFRKRVLTVDTSTKSVHLQDGSTETYDILISTVPLDVLLKCSDLQPMSELAEGLRYSTVQVVGVGLKGSPPPHLQKKCWMYFPEGSSPYYRATVFSNYSPNNVPGIDRYWSLMMEVARPSGVPADRGKVDESVITGLLATHLIESRNDIVDVWDFVADHGYPIPTLARNAILDRVLPFLEQHKIFSRGRFGGWKYEVSNQDHSVMQGVELVNKIVLGEAETTLWDPERANRIAR